MVAVFIGNTLIDRSLGPLRAQVASLIPDGTRLMDVGCANGRLLLENAGRLERGLGIDLDPNVVTYAQRQAERQGFDNLQFTQADALTVLDDLPFEPAHALASLFLHALWRHEAIEMSKKLVLHASTVIITDFVEPGSVFQKACLHFDEWLAGHRARYLAYRDGGGMPAILAAADLPVLETHSTPVPGVQVWLCGRPGGPGGSESAHG